MYPPLGLSIGTTNFVAVRAGERPVTRRSLLTLLPQGSPQLGSPAENPGGSQTGLLIDGFVECVGEQAPLVSADGSAHQPDLLLVDAIDAMVDTTGAAVSQLAIAVPAHWPPAAWQALQEALQTRASLSAPGAPPCLVSDAVAALAALDADRGVASDGVVALLDFGGGGTNITLADAASGFQPIDETVRCREFSGNIVDQAILGYIVGGTEQDDDSEPGGTKTVGNLTQLTDECRQAKERLSAQTATELIAELPGHHARIALTRAELEDLIRDPLASVMATLQGMLQRNGIGWQDLAALATVGGGAHIPLISEQLSARKVPVVTSQLPELAMAVGAALCVARGAEDAEDAEEAPTSMAVAVKSAGTTAGGPIDGELDGVDSPRPQDLAWSDEEIHEPAQFVGELYDDDLDARPAARARTRSATRIDDARRSSRLPQLVLGLGALVAMIGVGGVTYTLTSASRNTAPAQPAPSPHVQVAPPSVKPPAPAPVAAPPPSVAPSPAAPPPPAPVTTTTPPPPPPTTTTTTPPPPTTTTTTTTPPPTTTTTTTPATTVTTTTKPPPATTTAPSGAVPMTTEYLTLPLVPMPIPIQVPAN